MTEYLFNPFTIIWCLLRRLSYDKGLHIDIVVGFWSNQFWIFCILISATSVKSWRLSNSFYWILLMRYRNTKKKHPKQTKIYILSNFSDLRPQLNHLIEDWFHGMCHLCHGAFWMAENQRLRLNSLFFKGSRTGDATIWVHNIQSVGWIFKE